MADSSSSSTSLPISYAARAMRETHKEGLTVANYPVFFPRFKQALNAAKILTAATGQLEKPEPITEEEISSATDTVQLRKLKREYRIEMENYESRRSQARMEIQSCVGEEAWSMVMDEPTENLIAALEDRFASSVGQLGAVWQRRRLVDARWDPNGEVKIGAWLSDIDRLVRETNAADKASQFREKKAGNPLLTLDGFSPTLLINSRLHRMLIHSAIPQEHALLFVHLGENPSLAALESVLRGHDFDSQVRQDAAEGVALAARVERRNNNNNNKKRPQAHRGGRGQGGGKGAGKDLEYTDGKLKIRNRCKYCFGDGHWGNECDVPEAERGKQRSIEMGALGYKVDPQSAMALLTIADERDEDSDHEETFICTAILSDEDELDEDSIAAAAFATKALFSHHFSPSTRMILDTGANRSFTNKLNLLHDFKPSDSTRLVRAAFGTTGHIAGSGTLKAVFDVNGRKRKMNITNVLYVPDIGCTLLSVNSFLDGGLEVFGFGNTFTLRRPNGPVLAKFKRDRRQFVAQASLIPSSLASQTSAPNASSLPSAGLFHWHRALGHAEESRVMELEKRGLLHVKLNGIESDRAKIRACEGCLLGRATHRVAKGPSTSRAKGVLDRVHSDLYGPVRVAAITGETWAIGFTDDFSRYSHVVGLRQKGGAGAATIAHLQYQQQHLGRKCDAFRTDDGTEFKAPELVRFLSSSGIHHETSAPYRHEQVGVQERKWRTLQDPARAWLLESGLPPSLWLEALRAAAYITNLNPSKSTPGASPSDLYHSVAPTTDYPPSLDRVRPWGCVAFVPFTPEQRQAQGKLARRVGEVSKRGRRCYLVGYSSTSKAWRFYDPQARAGEKRVFEASGAEFLVDQYGKERSEEEEALIRKWGEEDRKDLADRVEQSVVEQQDFANDPVAASPELEDRYRDQLVAPIPLDENPLHPPQVPEQQQGPQVDPPANNDPPLPPPPPLQQPPPPPPPVQQVPPPPPPPPPVQQVPPPPPPPPPNRQDTPEPDDDDLPPPPRELRFDAPGPANAAPRPYTARERKKRVSYGSVRYGPYGRALAIDYDDESHEYLISAVQDDFEGGEVVATVYFAEDGALVVKSDNPGYAEALRGKDCAKWLLAMGVERAQHGALGTFGKSVDEVPKGKRVIKCKWVLVVKRNGEGEVEKFKARLVARGDMQRSGVDFKDTFSPTSRPTSHRILLALAVENEWETRQFDVTAAYLRATLDEEIYMELPEGDVVRLLRPIYGLRQAGREWYRAISTWLEGEGFTKCANDHALFTRTSPDGTRLYISLHVDDGILTGNDNLDAFLDKLNAKFPVRTSPSVSHFLAQQVNRDGKTGSITITQTAFIDSLLADCGMSDCSPRSTPLRNDANRPRPPSHTSTPLPVSFRSVIGSLNYLQVTTRLDISYATTRASRNCENPGSEDWEDVKRILRYLKGTRRVGIVYSKGSGQVGVVDAYVDADHAADPETRRSVTGFIFRLAGGAISWTSKRQGLVTLSSTEAEYVAMSHASREAVWLRAVLAELGFAQTSPTLIRGDNLSAITLADHPAFHDRTKHIAVHHHFVREKVADGTVRMRWIPTGEQAADFLTKGVGVTIHRRCMDEIGLRDADLEGESWRVLSLLSVLALASTALAAVSPHAASDKRDLTERRLDTRATVKCTANTQFLKNGKCVACTTLDKDASKCSTAGKITACKTKMFYSGKCYAAASCPSGTYANTSKKTCSTCTSLFPNSSKCTSKAASACKSGYFLNDGACVKTCPSGEYGSSGKCLSCFDKFPGSSTCTVYKATKCASSFFLSGSNCVDICPSGQYGSSGKCSSCSSKFPGSATCTVYKALTCKSPLALVKTVCETLLTTCEVGEFINTTTNRCSKCTGNSATCTATAALTCLEGFDLKDSKCIEKVVVCEDGQFVNSEQTACVACDSVFENVATCTATAALSCLDDFDLTAGKCIKKAITCPNGKYLSSVSKSCVNCAEVFSNTLTCDETTALTCVTGFEIATGKTSCSKIQSLECLDGEYLVSATSTCASCSAFALLPEQVLTCTEDGASTCAEGFEVRGGKCVTTAVDAKGCASGSFYYPGTKECDWCSTLYQGSETCDATGPTSCVSRLSYDSVNRKCFRVHNNGNCQAGTFLDQDGTCKLCSTVFSNALTCGFVGAIDCADGYYWSYSSRGKDSCKKIVA